jgi:hypothetical protein
MVKRFLCFLTYFNQDLEIFFPFIESFDLYFYLILFLILFKDEKKSDSYQKERQFDRRNDYSNSNSNRNSDLNKPKPVIAEDLSKLHPSWVAKKQMEEKLKDMKFAGKKITFNDDE